MDTLGFAPYYFDVAFQEMFTTFGQGKTWSSLEDTHLRDFIAYADALLNTRHQRIFLPFVALQQLALVFSVKDVYPSELLTVITAGEALQMTPEIRQWLKAVPKLQLINQYGPTESHVVTAFTVEHEKAESLPPIGQPIWNTRLYILDESLQWVLPGSEGQLYIGGDALALGYTDEVQTQQKFIENPYLSGERIYATGDWVKRDEAEQLHYVGRQDSQLKVRGYRVECGEIEQKLLQLDGVEQVVAVVEQQQIIVFWQGAARKGALEAESKKSFPSYMQPDEWHSVSDMKLTASGKINRQALLASRQTAVADTSLEPLSALAEKIRIIWQTLTQQPIRGNVSFFSVGGHSLLATQMVLQIQAQLGIEVPVRVIFESPHLSDFAEQCERLSQGGHEIPLAEAPFIASYAQQRLWFIEQWVEQGQSYHLSSCFKIEGEVDITLLQRALVAVIQRHEPLRTHFYREGDQVFQRCHDVLEQQVQNFDGTAEAWQQFLESQQAFQFNLNDGPVFIATIAALQPGYELLLQCHHIAMDGWSIGLLTKDIGQFYQHYKAQSEAPAGLSIQYKDYSAWQRIAQDTLYQQQLAYWVKQLDGVEAVHFPAWHEQAGQADRGAHYSESITGQFRQQLKAASDELGVSELSWLMACFKMVVFHYTQQTHIAIGVPVAGRGHSSTANLVGLFVNMQAIVADFTAQNTVQSLVKNVHDSLQAAQQHQDVPFDQVVEAVVTERFTGQSPIFQIVATYLPYEPLSLDIPGLSLEAKSLPNHASKFPMSMNWIASDDRLDCQIEYQQDLFDDVFIQQFMTHFIDTLQQALTNMSEPVVEVVRPTVVWPHCQAANPTGLLEGFDWQVELNPDALALDYGEEKLSYDLLAERSMQIGHWLQARNVTQGDRVVLMMDNHQEWFACMLAVLRVGAAYVPIAVDLPEVRLQVLLEDCQPTMVLHDHRVSKAHLAGYQATAWSPALVSGQPTTELSVHRAADQLAYIMYTSGSTGKPKGVAIPDAAIVRLVSEPNFIKPGGLRYAQYAPLSFDASTFECWMALFNGATLCPMVNAPLSLPDLAAEITARQIDVMWLTAPLFHLMVDYHASALATLQYCLAGGDALSLPHVKKALAQCPDTLFINGYGPTENTTFTCCSELNAASLHHAVPIGKAISGTITVVVDEYGQPVAKGALGELWAGGAGLAQGYWRNPALTEQAFVNHESGRYYRTGDWAYENTLGDLVFVGRQDQQVKLRGFRIELSEIEAQLVQTGLVSQAVILLDAVSEQLLAYVVPLNVEAFSLNTLQQQLHEALPSYMQPSAWQVMPALPLTDNGKIDKSQLPDIVLQQTDAVSASSDTEVQLLAIWQNILPTKDEFGVANDFFSLGGHSLLAAQCVAEIELVCHKRISLQGFFQHSTIQALAVYLDLLESDQQAPIVPLDAQAESSVSLVQQRFWLLQQVDVQSPHYNVPMLLALEGELDVSALQAAFLQTVSAHHILSATYQLEEGVVRQVQGRVSELAFLQIDESDALDIAQQSCQVAIDLQAGPILSARLFQLGASRYWLSLLVHHIAIDAVSLQQFMQEWLQRYQGVSVSLPKLQYADYAKWQSQHQPSLDSAWVTHLLQYPALSLPYDLPARKTLSHQGDTASVVLDQSTMAVLKPFMQQHGLTPFMLTLALWQIVVARWARQETFCMGTPVSGRTHPDTQTMMGCFVNTAVIPVDYVSTRDFTEHCLQVKQSVLASFEQQETPFAALVEALEPTRDSSRSPVFQVMMSLLPVPEEISVPGLSLSPVANGQTTAKLELSLDLIDFGEHIQGVVEYNSACFTADTMQGLAEQLQFLARHCLDHTQPLQNTPLFSVSEMRKIDYPQKSLMVGFDAMVNLHAERTAVDWGDDALTYQGLKDWVQRIAMALAQLEGDIIGVHLGHGVETIAVYLAAVSCGKTFLPLDLKLPLHRLNLILAQTEPAVMVVLKQRSDVSQTPQIVFSDLFEASQQDTTTQSASTTHTFDTPAYIMYTSGSTGEPKGVQITRNNLAYFIDEAISLYQLSLHDRVLQFSSTSFDACIEEIFPALWCGASVVIRTDDMHSSPAQFWQSLNGLTISVMSLPTAFWKTVCQALPEVQLNACLRQCIIGGEAADRDTVQLWQQHAPTVRLVNTYGPTEATVIATAEVINPDTLIGDVPIGAPLSYVSAQVLDQHGFPVAPHMIGELYLKGPNVSSGYWQDTALSTQCFTELGYKTGDLVKENEQGVLYYQGRTDNQIKRRGYRISLAEIESCLVQLSGMTEVVVCLKEIQQHTVLVAYWVSTVEYEVPQLREHVLATLPHYMLPDRWQAVADIPLSASGKVNLAQLPIPHDHPVDHAWSPADALEAELLLA
ncbi:MAG: amino acid adenylation domain-containing protein, partial [Methylococcales bacterium]|nr:amino acid adenylation domain-containing protein [Methylococcales bacterium]